MGLIKTFSMLLREIKDFYRFFWKTSKAEKKILFYAEHDGYYSYYEGLINKLVNDYKQTLCYVTSGPNDPILQKSDPKIKSFYIHRYSLI